ncbi:hypothetical protein JYU34_009882 [Plutella xylostella]|uniref:Peptidase A2 domain-containing protein n=1 Tax=Plutella xylostella TaxID=51655 RepID=A0ABQ7QKI8_PLUXY|nr:hypothetical protein JYU34_009882 [Plutella xylostella]
MSAQSSTEVLLCTALVKLINPATNQSIKVRALLDSGSQSSFITEAVKDKLSLTPQPSNTNIVGIGNTPINLKTERCALQLQSNDSSYDVKMTCLIIPKISDNLPKVAFDIRHLNLSNFSLADPSFNEPSPIEMLIGADLFWDIIGSQQHSLGEKNPILRSSKFGWLIAGPIITKTIPTKNNKNSNKNILCNFVSSNENLDSLNDELSRFWKIESFPQVEPLTAEEKQCEQHFLTNTTRSTDGRFCVALPLRDDPDCLGNSYSLAKKRFLNLEARFRRQPELKKAYTDFIHEYEELGHLSECPVEQPNLSYFLPHHPVFRESSESTKLRVVFDASARSTSGFSINDLQMVGPTIQDSLYNILLRFRLHKYVLSGDIEKMFRQVSLRESDRPLQQILWRDNEDEPLKTLQLGTVTYGFASASFLTTRCIWQVGEECSDPSIKSIIQRDLYCDDLLTGADSEE